MSDPACRPELVTGFVDEALDETQRAQIAEHIASCETCRAQAEEEGQLRVALRALPAPEPSAALEANVRASLRRTQRVSWLRYALPLAACLLVAWVWGRGQPNLVAMELAFDHKKCFGKGVVPAKVWSSDPSLVMAWFDKQGASLPIVPDHTGAVELIGGRFCPLADASMAPHLYYASEEERVSVFVVPHGVRFGRRFRTDALGVSVRLVRIGPSVVGIVGQDDQTLDGFESALMMATSVAALR